MPEGFEARRKALVFDANWHHEFYSEAVAQKVRENEAAYYRKTGMRTAVCTNDKPYYDSLPLSSVVRPAWDADALAQVGFDDITVIEDAGKEVYLDWEYELYGASPLFAVIAEKPVAAAEGSEAFNVLKATRDYWNERSNTFGLDGSIDKWGDLIQQKLLQRGVTSPWILDAGCGTGAMALTLASRGYRVCGVDFSQGMLLHARMNAKHQGLEIPLVLGCVDQLPFVSETFDVVVSRNVLSNLAVAKEALESWRDALRLAAIWCISIPPGGTTSTKNRWMPSAPLRMARVLHPSSTSWKSLRRICPLLRRIVRRGM